MTTSNRYLHLVGQSIHRAPTLAHSYIFRDCVRKNLLAYWLLLWFVVSTIVPSAQGFKYNPPPLISIPVQVLIVLFISNLLPRTISSPIHVLQVFSAIFLSIPTVIVSFSNWTAIEWRYLALALLYVLLNQVLVALFSGKKNLPIVNMRRIQISLMSIAYFLITITLVCFALILNSRVISIDFVGFDEIYPQRSELMAALVNSDSNYLGYTLGWVGGILLPIVFYIAIKERNRVIGALSVVLCFCSYVVTAQKWIIASFILIIFLHSISKVDASSLISVGKVLQGFNFLILSLIALQAVFYKIRFVDLGVRRAMLDPSIVLTYYVKFSSENPLRWWSETSPGRFLTSSDAVPVSNAIGERYFNQPELQIYPIGPAANLASSSFADSIAQGGVLGLLIYSLIIIGFFYLLQAFAVGRDLSFVFVLSGLVATMIFEGAFHTLLLSRGLIVVFFIFIFLPKVFKTG